MKALYERWTAIGLPKRILGGMILGAVLGMVIPQAVGISILGNLFVNALKGIAPLLVFFLVISSLCQAKQSHGGIIRTVVCLYLFNTLLGSVIAVVASKLFPITLTLAQAAEESSAPQGIAEVMQTLFIKCRKESDHLHRRGKLHRYTGVGGSLRRGDARRQRTDERNYGQFCGGTVQGCYLDHQLCPVRYSRTCV